MTEREAFDLENWKRDEFARLGGRCPVCNNYFSESGQRIQAAHVVPATKPNLKKYRKEIIHHKDNLVLVCSLRCNAAVIIHGEDEKKHIERIMLKLQEVY